MPVNNFLTTCMLRLHKVHKAFVCGVIANALCSQVRGIMIDNGLTQLAASATRVNSVSG